MMLNLILAILVSAADVDAGTPAPVLDTAQIEKLTGARGWYDEAEQTFRVSVPRTDVAIHVVGTRALPQQGLTSWATFVREGENVWVTGELVVTEEQVTPAIKTALQEGLDITSLHTHFMWEFPRVMFLGIRGQGAEGDLAFAVGTLLTQIHDPRRTVDRSYLRARQLPPKTKLNLKKLEAALGLKGELQRGVYKIALPGVRSAAGPEALASMGNQTWISIAGTDARALVTGELSASAPEVQGVISALVGAGFHITALHTPLWRQAPGVTVVHFWAAGAVEPLVRGVRKALDVVPTP